MLLVLAACGGRSEGTDTRKQGQAAIRLIRMESPSNGLSVQRGSLVDVRLQRVEGAEQPDSIVLLLNGQRQQRIDSLTAQVQAAKVGVLSVRATAWLGGQRQSAEVSLHVCSDIKPKQLRYRVVNSYPHDPAAYTQGLFVHGGLLYEGTGQNGASSLRRVDLNTGKVEQSVNLSNEHFGEGTALHEGRIYQLTWTSGVCFVYDAESLSHERTYSYSTQGWGLTSNGIELIMSDGSNVLRFMQPDGFAELRRVEVYDHQGPVRQLNELEYIDGLVYANVYTTDRIVLIDPQTGVVVAQADLGGILPASQRTGREDVLNGIAYDAERGRLFVTGKYWPKLFEIVLE